MQIKSCAINKRQEPSEDNSRLLMPCNRSEVIVGFMENFNIIGNTNGTFKILKI